MALINDCSYGISVRSRSCQSEALTSALPQLNSAFVPPGNHLDGLRKMIDAMSRIGATPPPTIVWLFQSKNIYSPPKSRIDSDGRV
jgi:hypothetical protein